MVQFSKNKHTGRTHSYLEIEEMNNKQTARYIQRLIFKPGLGASQPWCVGLSPQKIGHRFACCTFKKFDNRKAAIRCPKKMG